MTYTWLLKLQCCSILTLSLREAIKHLAVVTKWYKDNEKKKNSKDTGQAMNSKNQLKNQCRFHFVTKILSERQREIKNSLALSAFLTKVIKWNPSTDCLITARVNCCLGFGMRFISARCLMVFSSVAAGDGKCLMSWAQHLLSMLTHLNMIYVIW